MTLSVPHIEALVDQAGPHWYAVYTCARHEKPAAGNLVGRNGGHFLPQYETVSRWKDRRVRLSLPVFPGYLFVRIPLLERLKVLEVPSVVRLVGTNGHPTPLPEEDLEKLRIGLGGSLNAEPHPFLVAGRRVRIIRGPLEGLAGILLRRKGQFRVVLSLELIQRSIVVDVDITDIVPAIDAGRH